MSHFHGLQSETLLSEMLSENSLDSNMDEKGNSSKKRLFIEFEQHSMKKNLSTILVSLGMFFVLDQTAWSLSYDEYKQALSTQCEMNKDWTKDAPVSGNFALPPEYPELTREAIEKSRENLLISSRSS